MGARSASTPAVAAALLIAGCGGGPSDAERKAELARWADRADRLCRAAEESIVTHGAPADLRDLDAVAVRAAEDVRAAIAGIRRLRVPEDARAKVRPLLRELDRVEPMIERLTEATAVIDTAALSDLAAEFRSLKQLQEGARAAGLDDCMQGAPGGVVAEAIRAPIFATQISAFQQWFVRALGRAARTTPRTPAQTAAYYERLNEIGAEARRRWDRMQPPGRADWQAERYGSALADFARLAADVAGEIEAGRAITPGWARAVARRFRRVGRSEQRRMRDLLDSVGARPIPVDPAPEPEAEEQPS